MKPHRTPSAAQETGSRRLCGALAALIALAGAGCGGSDNPAEMARAESGAVQDDPAARATLRKELKKELKSELTSKIRDELRQELRTELGAELREELRREITRDLRRELKPQGTPNANTPPSPKPPQPARNDAIVTIGDDAEPGTRILSPESPVRLLELAVGTEVVDRSPQDVRERYAEVPDMLYCYSAIESRDADHSVMHVWRRGGVLVSRVELEVGRSPRWKTWSKQKTQRHWTGPWSCEVLDEDGQQLGITTFLVGP